MTNQQQWIDITSEILTLTKTFKLLQIVKDQSFSLQDGMHAHQINDTKIDPKHDISIEDTISYKLKNKQIKLPAQLCVQQIIAIYSLVLKQEVLIMMGYPLSSTIYKLSYLYDHRITQQVKTPQQEAISLLINSINNLGSYIYQLHKQSCSIKEDDLSINTFSFSTKFKTNDQLIKGFSNVEAVFNNKIKEDSTKSKIYAELIAFIKIRRCMHTLTKSMALTYDNKSLAKIQKGIQLLNQTIQQMEKIISLQNVSSKSQQVLKGNGIFCDRICKTLRTHFGPRQTPKLQIKFCLSYIQQSLSQLSLFMPVPTRVSLLKDKINRLHSLPLNLWTKSYIKNNIFLKDQHVFSTIKTQQLILNDINDFIGIKEAWKSDEKFQTLIKPTGPVVSQVLFRYLGRDTRSFWEVSKVYQDFNVLVHLSNQFDTSISPHGKKQLHLSTWYYNFGLNIMIKQLLSGIETQIYQQYEYPYVFYILQNLLGVYDRNSQIFLKKFDKAYQQSFLQQTLTSKKKKKLPESSRKFFSDTIFKKALHYYVRSFHRILFVLVNRKLIESPFEQQLETRIKNRFRIFKNVFFVRNIQYQQYIHDFGVIANDQHGYLTEAMELLKQAKSLFQKIDTLEQTDCNFKVKQDSQALVKICIKCTLAVMSLKMGQNKKTFKIQTNYSKYPQISVI